MPGERVRRRPGRSCSTPCSRPDADEQRSSTPGAHDHGRPARARRAAAGRLSEPAPTSTYRLQVRPSFDLYAAADVCDYLADARRRRGLPLAAAAVRARLRPRLRRRRASTRSTRSAAAPTAGPRCSPRPGRAGCGVVVDIVPEPHRRGRRRPRTPRGGTCCKHGRDSPYARWFDIEWSRGRLLLPVLGDDFDAGPSSRGRRRRAALLRAPLPDRARHRAGPGETAAEVHDRQHYELVNFRRADTEQNYRRFFAVTTLAGLRVEDQAVFARHARRRSRRWVRDDGIDGLRVDHPDGLADPLRLPRRLRELAGADAWIAGREDPRARRGAARPTGRSTAPPATTRSPRWAGVFVDPAAEAALDALYRELTGDAGARRRARRERQAQRRRRRSCRPRSPGWPGSCPDVDRRRRGAGRAARRLPGLPLLPARRRRAPRRRARAPPARRRPRPAPTRSTRWPPRLADPADELCARFQQTTGAVMAKGVEDTAYYRYTRFVALNEVGGDPAQFGVDARRVPRARRACGRQRAPQRHDDAVDARHQARRGRPGPAGRAEPSCRTSGPSWPRS